MKTNYKYDQKASTRKETENGTFIKTEDGYRQEVNKLFIYIMVRALERFATDRKAIGE